MNPPGENRAGLVLSIAQFDTSKEILDCGLRILDFLSIRNPKSKIQNKNMATAILPDGSKREVADGSSVMQLAESIGRGLAKAAIVAKVDDKLVDLSAPLPAGEH